MAEDKGALFFLGLLTVAGVAGGIALVVKRKREEEEKPPPEVGPPEYRSFEYEAV